MRVILFLLFVTLLNAKDVTGLQKYGDIVKSAIKKSSGKQKVILQNALEMVKNKKIVVGSCWDYIKGTLNNPMHSQHHKIESRQGTHLKD